ncbi:MAG: Bug family tripartite tricarboxylate transporter substrate binding protein [Burkholderiales bacterium]|nr:Bug family tripartite tricarboxylate transporter substrate binding protein [Burkholderiales bacterium]
MHLCRRLALSALLCAFAFAAQAQVDKPVRIVVGFAPGGSADIAARLIAERMKDELKQPVIVENRPGAGGRIVAESMKTAPADGSVLMLTPVVVPVLAPLVFSKLPYDPAVDFAPVAHVANFQFALGVNAAHPAKNVKELVAWYKANPAKANFGSPAPGSLPHFFGLMIGKGAGVELIHVPYNGGAPMMNGLMGDQVTAGIDTTVEMIELHRAGKIRILGTSGATRSPLLPDVPTLVESGLAGVEGTGWFAVYAPAKTPDATVRQLNAAINKALAAPEVRERFGKLGLEPTGGSAADLGKRMAEDTARWGPIVKASGFKAD